MEKKQLISVVKPLIAAALLFGSSGGVAWGQILQSGNLNPGTSICSGVYKANSYSWGGVDNNYGPGEGYYPSAPISLSSGSTISYGTIGRITVGGTSNLVGYQSSSPIVYIPAIPYISCYPHHSDRPALGEARIDAPDRPGVPDGTGVVGAAPLSYTRETYVQVTGTNLWNGPWVLDHLFFTDNPWDKQVYTSNPGGVCWNQGTCGSNSGGQTRISSSYLVSAASIGGYVDGRIHMLGGHIRLTGNGAATSSNGYKAGVGSNVGTSGTNAHFILPGGQYSLMIDKWFDEASISAHGWTDLGSGGGTAASDVLGVDAVLGIKEGYQGKDFKTHTDGSTILIGSANPFPGQDKMTITSPTNSANGHAFGFSALDNNCTSVYTDTWVPASHTGNLGNYGTNGTGSEITRAFTVLSTMKVAINNAGNVEMDNGKVQIYNTEGNIFYNNKIPKVPSGKAGNFLIMARDTLEMTANSNMANNIEGAGNITIMAGKVKLLQNEAITLTGSNSTGNYNVIAYATNGSIVGVSPSVGQLNFTPNCYSGTYSWCPVSPQAAELIRTPWPNFSSTGIGAQGGQSYATPCKPAFAAVGPLGDRGGNITFNGPASSTVNVEAQGSARWQAYVSISVAPGKAMNWEVKSTAGSSATASWLAGGNIGLGAGSTANWKTASAHTGERVFWDAGYDINTNSLTATWENSGKGGMHWRAGNAINAGTYSNPLVQVDWKSTSAATDGNMRWEAKAIRVDNGQTNPLTFTQESSKGYTDWNAEDSILVKIGKGVTFTNKSSDSNHAGRMVWLAAKGNIHTKDTTNTNTNTNILSFIQDHNDAGLNAWKAGRDILTDNVISFENKQQANKSNMQWYACHDIRTNHRVSAVDPNDAKKVTFDNKSEGHMIWHAGNDIDTRSKTEFISQQNSKGSVTWFAGNDIHTRYGTVTPSTLTNGVNFKQEGEGRTIWQAGHDLITHNAVHFQFTSNAKDWASLGLLAGRNIVLGGVNASEYDVNNTSVTNEFKVETEVNDTVVLHARTGHILTNSLVNIERSNTGAAFTKLWAGCSTFNLNK